MIAFVRSALFLSLATLITAPAGLLVTLSVVLPMKVRFVLIAIWRAGFMAICEHVLGLRWHAALLGVAYLIMVPIGPTTLWRYLFQ